MIVNQRFSENTEHESHKLSWSIEKTNDSGQEQSAKESTVSKSGFVSRPIPDFPHQNDQKERNMPRASFFYGFMLWFNAAEIVFKGMVT